MSENTKIERADHTFNPWVGCTKISPACDNCYAESWAKRSGQAEWGANAPRKRTSEANWKKPIKWDRKVAFLKKAWAHGVDLHNGDEAACIAAGFIKPTRPKVFCASLADVFDNDAPVEWLSDLFDLIRHTPNMDWLLLTKRVGNWKKRTLAVQDFLCKRISSIPGPRSVTDEESDALGLVGAWLMNNGIDTIPENVWIGATICNQEEADRDIPKLLAVPAAKRFLSVEPMLGAVSVFSDITGELLHTSGNEYDPGSIDWVICGGESGHNARPMHPDWVRSLRDQCFGAGVPFFFKQWGEWVPIESWHPWDRRNQIGIMPNGMEVPGCEWHDDAARLKKTGKKLAGRLLDGREWNEVPT